MQHNLKHLIEFFLADTCFLISISSRDEVPIAIEDLSLESSLGIDISSNEISDFFEVLFDLSECVSRTGLSVLHIPFIIERFFGTDVSEEFAL